MNLSNPVGARLGIALTLEFKDKDGNVLSRVPASGSVSLADTGMSVEEAQQFINQQEGANRGCDDRK